MGMQPAIPAGAAVKNLREICLRWIGGITSKSLLCIPSVQAKNSKETSSVRFPSTPIPQTARTAETGSILGRLKETK